MIVVGREVLSESMKKVKAALGAASGTKPILRSVHFSAKDGTATVTASDLEVQAKVHFPLVSDDFEALLPADRVMAILRESLADEFTLQVADGALTMKGNTSQFIMETEQPEHFPLFTGGDKATELMDAEHLAFLLKKVEHARGDASGRFSAMHGILVAPGSGDGGTDLSDIVVEATDGRRMAWIAAPLEVGSTIQRMLIPAKASTLIDAVLKGTVSIDQSDANKCFLRCDDGEVAFLRVQGSFPKTETMKQELDRAKTRNNPAKIIAGVLSKAIRQAAVMRDAETNAITLKFRADNDQLDIDAAAASSGKSHVVVKLAQAGEIDVDIRACPTYFLDFLAKIPPDDTVDIYPQPAPKPVYLEHNNFRSIIVPMVEKP